MTKQFYLYMQLKAVHVHQDMCMSDHRALPVEDRDGKHTECRINKQNMHYMHTT